jgi:hypothetical protein
MTDLSFLAVWANILSVPIAIISIFSSVFISIWIYLRSQNKASISCTIESILTPIEIKSGEALKGNIEIRYKEKIVDNIFVIRATIKNTGNVPIRKSHLVEDITFDFGENTEVLRLPEIIKKNPDNLKIEFNIGNPLSTAQLSFDLLNPKDEITAEFLCTGIYTPPKIEARIEGIKQIEMSAKRDNKLRNKFLRRVIVAILYLIFAIYIYSALIDISRVPQPTFSVTAALIFSWIIFSIAFIPYIIYAEFVKPFLEWRKAEDNPT